jgi:GNAT superfamily N-acetyltransferase/SAM-dependent methyltransferase
LIALWQAAGVLRPWNDPRLDIERARSWQQDLFLVGECEGILVASAMGGYDGHRGWVYYLAVLPEQQRRGHARALMAELERRLLLRGCPKLNLQVRADNTDALAFYERLGYGFDGVVAMGKRLIVDHNMDAAVDVPSPIDLRRPEDAAAWAAEALHKRPERTQIFAAFANELVRTDRRRVLELGSGPGFLALHVLEADPSIELTLVDFSAAMHELARERLGALAERVRFVLADFREPAFARELDLYDAVITNQAVHELRHKARAVGLHARVKNLLVRDGLYLVCDHFAGEGGMSNSDLYMTEAEQRNALRAAGFKHVDLLLALGSLVLLRARA